MSRRKRSTSVLDIPGTPLLDPAPGHQSPFNQEEEEEPPTTPSHLHDADEGRRKKKGVACAGIAVLGLVIVGALILVAVKQTQPREAVETERRRDFTTQPTSSTIKTNIFTSTTSTSQDFTTSNTPETTMSTPPDTTTQPPDDMFQFKLSILYQLVSKCKEMLNDEEPGNGCKDALSLATEENIDNLIEEMESRIKDAALSKNLASLLEMPEILDKFKTSSIVDPTTYLDIISGLQPVMDESHQSPLNTTSQPDRREDGGELDGRDSSSSYQAAVEVSCDQGRERRCRDKSACYPREKYCDFEVDCEDNSDEDDCSCVERLIDDRLCDATTDCIGGADEEDCGCGEGEIFCAPHPAFGPPECVKEGRVCDGVADCSNGRDEENCYLLGGDVNNLSPGTAASTGYLGVWTLNMSRYLPMGVEDGMTGEVIYARSKLACAGVVGSVPTFELLPATWKYEGMVAVMNDDDKGLLGVEIEDQKLVFVECGEKLCGTSSARNKRDLDKRVKRGNTYNVTCDDKLDAMNATEQEIFKNSAEYAVVCSTGENTDAKIVGGEVSYPDSWPYTVALYRDGQFICGATIVSTEWVVTAGHCVFGYGEGQGFFYQVRAGMVRRQSQSPWQQFRHLVEVFIHPEYDNTYLRHDIALAKLNSPLHINRHVQTICLPHDANMYPSTGSTCMATGWGDISEDGPSSEELREVEVPILAKCGRSYNNISYQICGGYTEGGKDACQGDSGGPLYCQDYLDNWYLGGVISHGRGCARAEEAGVYVRLAWYMDWVGQVLSGVLTQEDGPRDECGGVICGSGECVPGKWVCDLTVDCLDGGDVLGCVTLANGTRIQMVEEDATTAATVAVSTSVENSVGRNVSTFTLSTVSCTAEELKCSSLEQCVVASARCDGVRDCPDWSDERDCLCGEVISMDRVCDGVDDCRDQSDEVECELCGEAEWRCPLSGECVQAGAECNKKSDCRWGEDERFCTAFTQGSVVPVSSTGNLIPLSQGMLLINQEQAWKPLCAVKFSNSLVTNVCRYMGWPSGVKYDLIDPHDSPLNETVETQVQGRSTSCYHVNIQCEDDNCGARPMYRNLPPSTPAPLSGPGSWPWHANFFNEGEYVCGGSIVHKLFVLTDLSCAKMVVQAGSFITVLVGQEKKTNVGLGPYSQLRIVVSLKVVQGSTVVLAQMDRELEFNNHVNQLCISEESWTPSTSCVMSGMAGNMLTKTMETVVEKCSSTDLCLTTPASDVDTLNWSGALACADSKGRYRAVGVYHSTARSPPGRVSSLLAGGVGGNIARVITAGLAADPRVPADTCEGVRCGLGNCVKEENICDRNWDCQEGEDEANCPVVSSTSLALCEQVGAGPECSCLPGQLKCGNNLCLARAAWCDGVPDCGEGSDEPAECGACVTRLALLSPTAVCDSVPDCQDWSDETSQACGCQPDSFRCDQPLNSSSSPSCVPVTALCDGTPDCPGGTDESPAQCIALSTLDTVKHTPLLAPVATSVGYLKARTFGVWYTYCAETWSDVASSAVCRALGYSYTVSWTTMVVSQVEVLGGENSAPPSSCSTVFLSCGS